MGNDSHKSFEQIQLLIKHQSALRGFIISMIPGSQDVEDVLQDTNLVLWEKIDSFELGTEFRAWAFTIARNVTLAHLRRMKRDRSPAINKELMEVVADTWYSREASDPSTREMALDHCLSRLSTGELEIVKARYRQSGGGLEGFSAIAKRSPGSLRVSLFRIRTKLRECVRGQLAIATTREEGAV